MPEHSRKSHLQWEPYPRQSKSSNNSPNLLYSSRSLASGCTFQHCQWMPESTFWHNTLPSVGTCFLLTFSSLKFSAFSILRHCGRHFCSLRSSSKISTIFFFLFHNFTDESFILTRDLSNLSIGFDFFFLSLLS